MYQALETLRRKDGGLRRGLFFVCLLFLLLLFASLSSSTNDQNANVQLPTKTKRIIVKRTKSPGYVIADSETSDEEAKKLTELMSQADDYDEVEIEVADDETPPPSEPPTEPPVESPVGPPVEPPVEPQGDAPVDEEDGASSTDSEFELDTETTEEELQAGNPEYVKVRLEKNPQCNVTRRLEHPGVGKTSPRIQYVHNPKAGGTTIQKAMYAWSFRNPNSRFIKYDLNEVGRTSWKCPAIYKHATILAGHRGYGFCRNVENDQRGLFSFTAFRDPVARMVSWYDYNLYDIHEERAVKVFGSLNKPLSAIVKQYNKTKQLEWGEKLIRYSGQQQSRFMCGYMCMGPIAKGNKNLTEEVVLKTALKNLAKLDVIGLTEELDEMIPQLKFHLPQLIPRKFTVFPRENVYKRERSVLDDEARSIMKEWARVDEELYRQAKILYEKKKKLASECLSHFGEV